MMAKPLWDTRNIVPVIRKCPFCYDDFNVAPESITITATSVKAEVGDRVDAFVTHLLLDHELSPPATEADKASIAIVVSRAEEELRQIVAEATKEVLKEMTIGPGAVARPENEKTTEEWEALKETS